MMAGQPWLADTIWIVCCALTNVVFENVGISASELIWPLIGPPELGSFHDPYLNAQTIFGGLSQKTNHGGRLCLSHERSHTR